MKWLLIAMLSAAAIAQEPEALTKARQKYEQLIAGNAEKALAATLKIRTKYLAYLQAEIDRYQKAGKLQELLKYQQVYKRIQAEPNGIVFEPGDPSHDAPKKIVAKIVDQMKKDDLEAKERYATWLKKKVADLTRVGAIKDAKAFNDELQNVDRKVIRIQIEVDGKDYVVFDGSTIQVRHKAYKFPLEAVVNGERWKLRYGKTTYSNRFQLPYDFSPGKIEIVKGRGAVELVDNQVYIYDPADGADVYEFVVSDR